MVCSLHTTDRSESLQAINPRLCYSVSTTHHSPSRLLLLFSFLQHQTHVITGSESPAGFNLYNSYGSLSNHAVEDKGALTSFIVVEGFPTRYIRPRMEGSRTGLYKLPGIQAQCVWPSL